MRKYYIQNPNYHKDEVKKLLCIIHPRVRIWSMQLALWMRHR